MKQHDASALHTLDDALIDFIRADALPVQAVYGPLDRGHSLAADSLNDMVVVLPIGTADKRWLDPGAGRDLAICLLKVSGDFVGTHHGKVVMMRRMAHDFMSCLMKGFDRIGIFFGPVAYDKKSRMDTIA